METDIRSVIRFFFFIVILWSELSARNLISPKRVCTNIFILCVIFLFGGLGSHKSCTLRF